MKLQLLIASLLLSLSLSACKDAHVIDDPAKITATQQELEQATFDLSQVMVAKLKLGDRAIEVTSLTPVIAVQANVGGVQAKTILRFSDKRDMLTLFTRDVKNKKAYRVDVPVADLQAKKSVKFPILSANGEVTEQVVTFDSLLVK